MTETKKKTLTFEPELPDTPSINVLLVGSPKSGKTTGAATGPGDILYLNCDLPTRTRFARQRTGRRFKEVRFESLAMLHVFTAEAMSGKYGTVVVDPIGELHRQVLEEESRKAVRPTMNQYGDTSSNVERFCRALCKAPCNTILVCHDYPVKDEASGEVLSWPWTGTTNPTLGRKLMGMVDVIGYTGVVETEDGEREYVAQLAQAKGRPAGGYNELAGDKGYRPVNIAEWVQVIQAAEKEKTA